MTDSEMRLKRLWRLRPPPGNEAGQGKMIRKIESDPFFDARLATVLFLKLFQKLYKNQVALHSAMTQYLRRFGSGYSTQNIHEIYCVGYLMLNDI